MTAQLFASIGFFSGLDTITDSTRLRTTTVQIPEGYKHAYPLTEAMNVDIDDSYALASRSGLTEKLSGSGMHSLWANEEGTLCFFMSGNSLYKLNADFSSALITTLSSANRVDFCEVNTRVYLTNEVDIGYIENDVYHNITDPNVTYKRPLPAGKFLCFYKGRIHVAKQKVMYISDALSDSYDIRYGFRTFVVDINMMLSVDEGMYISDNQTWFISQRQVLGNDQLEMYRQLVHVSQAIPYTGIRVIGDNVSENKVEGIVGIWVSDKGICVGDNKGNVENVTHMKYDIPYSLEGTAFLRSTNGLTHYLAILRK